MDAVGFTMIPDFTRIRAQTSFRAAAQIQTGIILEVVVVAMRSGAGQV